MLVKILLRTLDDTEVYLNVFISDPIFLKLILP